MANPTQPPLDYSRFNPRASGLPQFSEEEAQEVVKRIGIEGLLFMLGGGAWKAGQGAYQLGKGAYQAGLPGLKAQWASLRGAPIPAGSGVSVDEAFVQNPGYHGTEYPNFFERVPGGVAKGVEIPSKAQKEAVMKAPTFSISSEKRFADVFAGKGDDAISRGDIRRTIPVLIDKKATGKVLDFRNASHNKYIKSEYKKFRKDLRKDLEEKVVPNTKMYEKSLKAFDESTAENLALLDKPNATNWHIIEKIVPQLKERGWKAFTTTEGNTLNLQIIDPKMIRSYRNEAGDIVNAMNEGGKVPGGGIGNFVAENLRKKQVTVHKPSKSLVKQGYSPEARLKARYRNTSYFG